MAEILLAGCTPIPLASYLKALGVFRLVAEQKDKGARGCWRDEAFVLDTALTDKELVRFFLDEYCPSPIISPWNGGSGFYFQEGKSNEKDAATGKKIKTGVRDQQTAATRILDSFAATKSNDRLALYKGVIFQTRGALRELDLVEAPADDKKRALVMRLRACLPEECLTWLDAAIALTGETLSFPPLLGSGGNDGNLDFSSNFMQRLADVIDTETGVSRQDAQKPLESALFGNATTAIGKGAIGQFAPGAAGGPNATAGFERGTLVNSWDYILMLEGALVFAANATRRLGAAADPGALSYPFTVRATSAAGAGAAMSDEGDARGEIWLPLWNCAASLAEIAALFSEGRATLGRRPVEDGLDFARAAAMLGVDRGIPTFRLHAALRQAYVAAPMSRVRAQRNPKAALLNDLDRGAWLRSFRRYARGDNAPVRLRSLACALDESIFAMTEEASAQAVQRVLIAVGEAAAYLVSSPKARDPKEGKQKPPPRLRSAWFHAADDESAEFRVAAALAGLGRAPTRAGEALDDETYVDSAVDDAAEEEDEAREDDGASVQNAVTEEEQFGRIIPPPPLRAHLAPVDEKFWYARFHKWSDKGALVVWGGGALERNLAAVIERRLLFAAQRNLDGGPFDGRAPADLTSVLAFLAGDADDARIAALAQGLAWAEAPNALMNVRRTIDQHPLPFAYALMKPFFASNRQLIELGILREGGKLPVPPGLVARLRAGDVGVAVTLACRRARASGLPVTFEPRAAHVADMDSPRLLASLLIPIRKRELKRVLEQAYPALFGNGDTPKEDPADAA